jgi:hypothetical protein
LGLDPVEDLLYEILDCPGLSSGIGLGTTRVLAIPGDTSGLPEDQILSSIHYFDSECDLDLPLQHLGPLPNLAWPVVAGGIIVAGDTSADDRVRIIATGGSYSESPGQFIEEFEIELIPQIELHRLVFELLHEYRSDIGGESSTATESVDTPSQQETAEEGN